MTRSQFDAIMPEEFWREVVDRINAEMPNTLLLAEAFWLMEGYFVRTLGMHRVYNSAFMHMFMKEENEKYKLLIKNTLAFNPEILKRYVNFMSNPDEETAINQFGKGDKYFGVATMLITLPGLPMFAHGQIEGLSEKYGMEYKRAYYDEFTDDNLIVKHEKEIFPLTKKRYLFSQVDNFELYDFIDPHGICNENVFAFTNRSGQEVSLVIYNNSYSEAYGSINYSCERAFGEEGRTTTTTIDKALGINFGDGFYYIFKDYVQQLEYIISGSEISSMGFSFHLMGYQRKVLLGFKEVYDSDGRYKRIYEQLNGKGVDSIDRALNEMNFAPFHNSLTHLFTSIKFSRLLLSLDINNNGEVEIPNFDEEIIRICGNLNKIKSLDSSIDAITEKINSEILSLNNFNLLVAELVSSKRPAKWLLETKSILYSGNEVFQKRDLSFFLINRIIFNILNSVEHKNSLINKFDELLLWKPLIEILSYMRFEDPGKSYELLKVINIPDATIIENSERFLNNILKNDLVGYFIQINEYEKIKYFNKERIEEFVRWQFIISCTELNSMSTVKGKVSKKNFIDSLKTAYDNYSKIMQKILESEYKVEKLVSIPEVKIAKKIKPTKKGTSKKKALGKGKSKVEIKEKEKTNDKPNKKLTVKKTKTKKKAKT